MGNILYSPVTMVAVHGIHKVVNSLNSNTIFILFLAKKKKSLIERTIQYIKDRTESFDDDYFPCRKQNCKLGHIKQWITVFAWHHNNNIRD
ncbi:MAG: hypothetical protein R2685_02520 [Candidatus Nitrosocosmicus sp.]|nr:hypothetical protein [Candidatus Nitrosocosmicus sp.]